MLTKTCKWCHQTQSLDKFPKHKAMADGHLNKCASCCREYVNAHRKTPAGKASRQKEKQYPDNKKRYKQTEKGKQAAKRYKRDPVRESAKGAVAYALRRGKLTKEPCFVCGEKALSHHSSYASDMKLAVTWLCLHHHNQLHNEHKGYKTWI